MQEYLLLWFEVCLSFFFFSFSLSAQRDNRRTETKVVTVREQLHFSLHGVFFLSWILRGVWGREGLRGLLGRNILNCCLCFTRLTRQGSRVRPGALRVLGSQSPSLSFKRHQTASHYTLITVLFYCAVSEVCIRFPSKSSVLFHNWSRVPIPPCQHTIRVEWEQTSRPLQLQLGHTTTKFSQFWICVS